MDNNSFKHLLDHFPENSIEDAEKIFALKKRYPYSQVLHALAARLSKEHNLSRQSDELQLAAVYATDRSVLKEVMVAALESNYKEEDTTTYSQTVTASVTEETESSFSRQQPILDSYHSTLVEEVMRDLERLTELKNNFELMFMDGSDYSAATSSSPPVVETEIIVEKTPFKRSPRKVDAALNEKSGLTKKERIIALAKEADALAQSQALDKHTPTKKKKSSGDSTEGLIEEIASTKRELNPESEKQKEQIEIIDQFIKAQPTITNKDRLPTAPIADLTSIKSGEFGDNVVSETLVDILIHQGKKDKAIEVLKKLIWKFPQKKAYFAAQIEELKK